MARFSRENRLEPLEYYLRPMVSKADRRHKDAMAVAAMFERMSERNKQGGIG